MMPTPARPTAVMTMRRRRRRREKKQEWGKTAAKSATSTYSITPAPPPVKSEAPVSPAPATETSQACIHTDTPPDTHLTQENYCDMRINLNQKPNSSRDFGFQANWDSTGARVTSVQPGSAAEMCKLQAGDEVLTVNGHQVAEMSYLDWKASMEEALQEGSLVMDVRRHGKNTWDRDQPSLPHKGHKTINLTSMDHPILLGSPDPTTANKSLDFTSHISTETFMSKEAPAKPVIDVASNGVNGSFREAPVTMRNKGGSESAMPDIPVPSITPSSSRWSWDPEEERKRQEKWQKEQERLLQEKYKRDQEKLQEEWLKAQQEIEKPTSTLWEEEERKRKEELERQRQAEERRRREEEERELQHLQEERERRERQEEEERKRREEEELKWQRRKEEERRQQEAAEQQRRERERALEQQWQQRQWAKSKSSPQLDEEEKPQRKVTGGGAGQQPLSQAELERQQILNEMKKKTPLLTDGSWIRQQSVTTATNKESDIPPMRRGESLDNLDSNYNSWRSSWTPRTNSYAPNYPRPHSALSGSTSSYSGGSGAQRPASSTLPSSYSMGSLRGAAGTPTPPWARQTPSPSTSSPSPTTSPEPMSDGGSSQQRSRSVSGKKICTFCDNPLGKGAAMIIESLGLCYHLSCFKCIECKSDLGGSQAGAEVRIRNKQLYCNSCYMRVKTGQPTTM
ncbi:hypothetical protein INR49_030380 [Caranx melampygus]|nr:hypothetical protein INR49_030380 [Caranx melampygus]